MLKCVFEEANTFITIIKTLKGIVAEADFIFDADGLNVCAISEDHISMVDLLLPKTAFEEYNLEVDKGMSIALKINLKDANEFLARITKDVRLTLTVPEDISKLIISSKENGHTKRFSMLTYLAGTEEDEDSFKFPDLDDKFNTSFTIKTGMLYSVIKDAELTDEQIIMTISKKGLQIESKSEISSADIFVDADALEDVILPKEKTVSIYSIKQFIAVLTHLIKDEDIKCELATNLPIQLTYPLVTGQVRFLVAPRIEGEDE